MKKSKRQETIGCDPLTLTQEQQDRLTALSTAQEESDREERFVFLRQQEEDVETLRVIQELITDSGLAQGKILSLNEITRFLTLIRALAPNPSLDARILRRPQEPEALSQELTQLLFGDAALYRRLTDFLSRRHVGGQTAFQLLAAVFPKEFPLISNTALWQLEISPEQHDEAIAIARRCFQLAPDIPNSDPVVKLLANVPIYLAAKNAQDCPDYLTTYRLLTQKPRGMVASRKLSAQLYAPPPNRIAETKSTYLSLPEPIAQSKSETKPTLSKESVLQSIESEIAQAGFTYPPLFVRSAFLSLQSKPLLWLLGRNGVGKTRLSSLIANAITGNARQYLLLPVRPDWHDSTPLLGYVNVLAGQYVRTPFLDFLIEAAQPQNTENAYFLCLDEMNLARIEHYFAEVLSELETPQRTLTLPNGQTLDIPRNLFVMGTLNSDEATVSLSRRVLDRANTLTLNTVHLDSGEPINLSSETEANSYADRQSVFLTCRVVDVAEARTQLNTLTPKLTLTILDTLVKLNAILEQAELGFAYRVRDEILIYCVNAFDTDGNGLLCPDTPRNAERNLALALDFEIVQKILPRISGTAEQIFGVLNEILVFANTAGYSQTVAHCTRLQNRLTRDGFVRFDEV